MSNILLRSTNNTMPRNVNNWTNDRLPFNLKVVSDVEMMSLVITAITGSINIAEKKKI